MHGNAGGGKSTLFVSLAFGEKNETNINLSGKFVKYIASVGIVIGCVNVYGGVVCVCVGVWVGGVCVGDVGVCIWGLGG